MLKKTGQKGILFDPRLMPRIALLDPDLTKDLPPHLTAATGMDAFTHCLESYVCPVFHPVADAIALGGIELVIKNLPVAVQDGQNGEARGYMAIAAMMGALAFQKDLGAAHSMATPSLHHFRDAAWLGERDCFAVCHEVQPGYGSGPLCQSGRGSSNQKR